MRAMQQVNQLRSAVLLFNRFLCYAGLAIRPRVKEWRRWASNIFWFRDGVLAFATANVEVRSFVVRERRLSGKSPLAIRAVVHFLCFNFFWSAVGCHLCLLLVHFQMRLQG